MQANLAQTTLQDGVQKMLKKMVEEVEVVAKKAKEEVEEDGLIGIIVGDLNVKYTTNMDTLHDNTITCLIKPFPILPEL